MWLSNYHLGNHQKPPWCWIPGVTCWEITRDPKRLQNPSTAKRLQKGEIGKSIGMSLCLSNIAMENDHL
jgi:hypothetical protein